jgi:hypothetical protein
MSRESNRAKGFIPNVKVAERYQVTTMCLWRWNRNEKMRELGWPPDVNINGRKYKHAAALDQFDENLQAAALDALKTAGRKKRKAA